jgi:hypothetical protein
MYFALKHSPKLHFVLIFENFDDFQHPSPKIIHKFDYIHSFPPLSAQLRKDFTKIVPLHIKITQNHNGSVINFERKRPVKFFKLMLFVPEPVCLRTNACFEILADF